jgi:acyl carrier protein
VDNQIHCPICRDRFIAEFYEPRGTALCLQCGATLRRLRDRLVVLGKLEPDQITPDTSFIDILNMNSLDVAELVMALEEEGSELTRAEAAGINTIKDLVRAINAHRSGNR